MEETAILVQRFQNSLDQRERELVFREIYGRYLRLVYAAIRKTDLSFSHEQMEDVAQETMLVVANRLDEFVWESEIKFRSWLYAIAANKTRLEARRIREKTIAVVEKETEAEAADEFANSDENAMAALFRLWREFDETGFDLNFLFLFKGKKDREIGELLGISAEAARKRRSRALKLFSEHLSVSYGVDSSFDWIRKFSRSQIEIGLREH